MATGESVMVAAGTRSRRQPAKMLHLSAAEYDIIRPHRLTQAFRHLEHPPPPLPFSITFERRLADVLFVGASLLEWQMRQFHRDDDAVGDEGAAEAGAQTQKQHAAALVAAQRLHCGVVDDL